MILFYLKSIFINRFFFKLRKSQFYFRLSRFVWKLCFVSYLSVFFFKSFYFFHSNLINFFIYYYYFFLRSFKNISFNHFFKIDNFRLFSLYSNYQSFFFSLIRYKIFDRLKSFIYYIIISGSKRNSFITFSNFKGNVLKSFSCGQDKEFKKSKKKMWYAHLKLAERSYRYIRRGRRRKRLFIIRINSFKYQCRSILKFFIRSIR